MSEFYKKILKTHVVYSRLVHVPGYRTSETVMGIISKDVLVIAPKTLHSRFPNNECITRMGYLKSDVHTTSNKILVMYYCDPVISPPVSMLYIKRNKC